MPTLPGYYLKNREAILARGREYRLKNRDVILAQKRVYRQENSTAVSASGRKYYVANRERRRAQNRAYWLANRDSILVHQRQYSKASRRAKKAELYAAYGNACACCGERREEFLTIDHINGGGRAHRKQLPNQDALYADIRRLGYPKDRFRLLCWNCNAATSGRRLCPHQRETDTLLASLMKPCPHQVEIAAMAQASGLDTHADVANAPVSLGHAM